MENPAPPDYHVTTMKRPKRESVRRSAQPARCITKTQRMVVINARL